jgi:type I restriction enzyme, S subunit
VDGRVIQATIENVTKLGIEHSSAVELPAGTVCFSRTASVGFVTVMGREMATSQDFVNWVCGPELNPVFLMHAMIASRRTLLGLANGSTHRTIYFPTVEEFRCIIPPIGEQLAFTQFVESLDGSRVRAESSIGALEGLFSSLQHRAFRGEL